MGGRVKAWPRRQRGLTPKLKAFHRPPFLKYIGALDIHIKNVLK